MSGLTQGEKAPRSSLHSKVRAAGRLWLSVALNSKVGVASLSEIGRAISTPACFACAPAHSHLPGEAAFLSGFLDEKPVRQYKKRSSSRLRPTAAVAAGHEGFEFFARVQVVVLLFRHRDLADKATR